MSSKTKIKYPLGIQWKIPKNELQKLRSSINESLESKRFQIPETDIELYVSIFPNGFDAETRGETWIFLYIEFEEQKEIEAQFTISVNTANISAKLTFVYEKSYGSGEQICKVEELFDPKKQLIVDGYLGIGIEGFAMIEREKKPLKYKSGGDTLGMELWYQDNKDFIIVVDGKVIKAHKNVLSTRSPVFAAMLKPHTKEAQESRVTITDFAFGIVEAAIKLCYHTILVNDISLDDAMSLLQFFDKYQIHSLKERLEDHLISAIDETSVCDLINSSINSNAPKLKLKCTEFLRKCLDQHKPVNNFDNLDKEFALNFLKNSFTFFSS